MARVNIRPPKKGEARTSKAEMSKRINNCIILIKENKNSNQIVEILTKKYKVGESTVRRYYSTAIKKINSTYENDIKEIRYVKLTALEHDRDTAYNNYKSSGDEVVSLRWFQVYLDVKKTIRDFYSELEHSSDSDNTVSIKLKYDPRDK